MDDAIALATWRSSLHTEKTSSLNGVFYITAVLLLDDFLKGLLNRFRSIDEFFQVLV